MLLFHFIWLIKIAASCHNKFHLRCGNNKNLFSLWKIWECPSFLFYLACIVRAGNINKIQFIMKIKKARLLFMLFFNSILYLIWKGEVVDKKFIQNREIIIDKFSSYKDKKKKKKKTKCFSSILLYIK